MYNIGEQVHACSDDNMNYFPGTIVHVECDYTIILCCIPYKAYFYRIRLSNGEMLYNIRYNYIKRN